MSDIIYTPPASSGGGTTINPTNTVLPVRSNATTFVDSNITNNIDSNIYTNLVGSDNFGWFVNFVGKEIYLGDFDGIYNGTSVNVSDSNQFINFAANSSLLFLIDGLNQVTKTAFNGNDIGLKLDFGFKVYQLGDFNFVNNNTAFYVNDSNETIYTSNQGAQNGILLDFLNGTYYFGNINGKNQLVFELNRFSTLGDYLGNGNSSTITIDDQLKTIFLYTNGNNTTFLVDGNSDKLTFTTNALNFDGAGLQSNTSSGNSGEHLVITLNGSTYKIQLLNP